MAAAVVSAHNHVLRRWLRREAIDPVREIDAAMAEVVALFTQPASQPSTGGSVVLVLRDDRDPEEVAAAVRAALNGTADRAPYGPSARPTEPVRSQSDRDRRSTPARPRAARR
jgi:hypothetical protein